MRNDLYKLDTPTKLAGGALGSPFASFNWTMPTAAGSQDLPAEVAVCASFRASYAGLAEESGSTRPRARRRGRVYLGPVMTNILGVTAGETHVGASFPTVVVAAMEALRTDTATSWGVWSRADAATSPVVAEWCDDAFDTIRKRGPKATTRISAP